MSEVEKLYELAGVKFPPDGIVSKGITYYYPFTAEKQLKILCFIVNNKHSVTFHDSIFTSDKLTLEKIQENLAWAINRIWQDLTETEQEEIRKILKG